MQNQRQALQVIPRDGDLYLQQTLYSLQMRSPRGALLLDVKWQLASLQAAVDRSKIVAISVRLEFQLTSACHSNQYQLWT
jgi:hypothetical protein